VATLALVASLYLLLRRGNAILPENTPPLRVRRWAAAFFASIAAGHMWWLFISYSNNGADSFNRILICTSLDFIFCLPAILCTMLVMLQDRRRPLWPVAIIVILALIGLLMTYFLGDRMSVIILLFFFICVLSIIIVMVRAVRQYGRWLRDNYADLEHKGVGQTFLLLIAFLLVAISYNFANDYIACEILVEVFDIFMIIILLWRVETLQTLEEPALEEPAVEPVSTEPMAEEVEAAEVTEKTEDDAEDTSDIGHLLVKYCELEQYYLNNDISVNQLAEHIGTNRKYLGRYFSQQGITYNTYINGLRILHFIRIYQNAVKNNQYVTASQLSVKCGFSSYSTFSAAFKQTMGQTVTAWIQSLDKDQASSQQNNKQ